MQKIRMEACSRRLAASLQQTLVVNGNMADGLSTKLNKYRRVRTMKFRRDIIFDDRILVALCVGTAILGLVALILVE